MKNKIFIILLSLCVLLSGCNSKPADSNADATPEQDAKKAVLYTNMTTGSEEPDIKEYTFEYFGELTAEVLADGLSKLTGLDFKISITDGRDDWLSVDWAKDSTLVANLGDREQKEEFHFFDADSMRWFMMDSLWLTLTKNLNKEKIYYTMDGSEELMFEELYPVNVFPAEQEYMGSAFFFAHADGKGDLAEGEGDSEDGRGDLIPMNDVNAMELVRQSMNEEDRDTLALVGGGEDTVEGEHAIIIIAGKKSADGKNFKELRKYAVTDSGGVYCADTVDGSDWTQVYQDPGPGDPGDTNQPEWWGVYKSDELGFSVEINEFSVTPEGMYFEFVIYLLRNGSQVLAGTASVSEEDEHLAICDGFDGMGFYLYDDFSAIDINTSESSEWAHMRGKYTKIE